MTWRIEGTYYGPCSCKVSCPCELGEPDGDFGNCSGSLIFDIKSGNIEGIDVGGVAVALNADWPRGFVSGNGTARLYFDPSTSGQQREALEAVIGGKKGGVFEGIAPLIPKVLPSKEAKIEIKRENDTTRIKVGEYGDLVQMPLRGATGEITQLLHGAFAFRDRITLARGTGSRWRDPEMRSWESGGHAEEADFDWSG